jgi:hypothetical protein
MIRTMMAMALLAMPAAADPLALGPLICQTVGMQDVDGSVVPFHSPGRRFVLEHDGRDVLPDPASPLTGFPTMIVQSWDEALERYLEDNRYRIVLFSNGVTEAAAEEILHFPVAGVFETGMRDNALVHHCRADVAPAS